MDPLEESDDICAIGVEGLSLCWGKWELLEMELGGDGLFEC